MNKLAARNARVLDLDTDEGGVRMRMLPTRYAHHRPAAADQEAGLGDQPRQAPLKGLDLSTKLSQADPLTAPILDNWVVEEDQISCRPGFRMIFDDRRAQAGEVDCPVLRLAREHGGGHQWQADHRRAARSARRLPLRRLDWTSFANLGVKTYTVMVNGKDGVWRGTAPVSPPGSSRRRSPPRPQCRGSIRTTSRSSSPT